MLRELGLRPCCSPATTARPRGAVAAEVGIDADEPGAVIAEVLPEDKVEAVRRLQAGGQSSPWWATA